MAGLGGGGMAGYCPPLDPLLELGVMYAGYAGFRSESSNFHLLSFPFLSPPFPPSLPFVSFPPSLYIPLIQLGSLGKRCKLPHRFRA